MKKIRLTFVLTIFSFMTLFGQDQNAALSFDWLEGTYEKQNTKSPKKSFEKWWKNRDGQLQGIGWTTVNQDTVFIEKLNIINKGEKWYYVAEVSHNQKPILFEIIEISDQGFISENPEHDFPKRIEYQMEGERMIATISADGRSIPFYFKKLNHSSEE